MDGLATAHWLRDCASVDARDFIERFMWALGERELGEIKSVRSAMKQARRDKQYAIERMRRDRAAADAKQQEARRFANLARLYENAARAAFAQSQGQQNEGAES